MESELRMIPKIAPITTNMEKKTAYEIQMERFKRAKAGGFHLEAIFILYALIEDRLSGFLFHAGITNATREKITRNGKVRPHLDSALTVLSARQPSIRNVSAKIKLIKELLAWLKDYTANEPSRNYPDALCKQINRTAGKDQMIETLTRIEGWCVSRNELVHALLNKKVENQEEMLQALVAEGEACNRQLQNFVKSFKVSNTFVNCKTLSSHSRSETLCVRPSIYSKGCWKNKMSSDQNNNSGCLFPFGDDFLPILMLFFHVNQPNPGASDFDDENEQNDEWEIGEDEDDS